MTARTREATEIAMRPASSRRPFRVAAIVSHPIQYQAPLFRELSRRPEIDLNVLFCERFGAEPYLDKEFGRTVKWDSMLLDGYRHQFFQNWSPEPCLHRPWGILNPGLISHLARANYDAVWIHGWAWLSNWLGLSCAAALRVPILLRAETNGLAEPSGYRGYARRLVLRSLFRAVSGFLSVGSNNERFYACFGIERDRIFRAPYSVDNQHFARGVARSASDRMTLRAAESIDPSRLVILFTGKLLAKKRPGDLLRAVALSSVRDQVTVAFAGDGQLAPELRAQAANLGVDIRLLGFRNQNELPAYYAMADLFVLPSAFEPWGLVLNEAMCAGLPVIASDRVGAAADLIREGLNGFTFPAGDVRALAAAIDWVLSDSAARLEMGRKSRELIGRWGIEQTADGVLAAVQSVCRKS